MFISWVRFLQDHEDLQAWQWLELVSDGGGVGSSQLLCVLFQVRLDDLRMDVEIFGGKLT